MSTPEELHKLSMKIETLRVILNDYKSFATAYSDESNNLAEIRVRLDEIPEFSEKFEEYQSQVEMATDITDQEWIETRRQFRNLLCSVKASLFKILDNAKAKEEITSPSVCSPLPQQQFNSFNAMRYPPCSLPTFDGNWQQWSSFIDIFNSMFHNEHSNLPFVQRFHYLKSCLTGQASDVIKSIPTTAENFTRAYDLLVNRYENKGAIIQSHIRSLLDTPKVSTPSGSELQKLHHHISSNINALRSLQQPVDQWDAWLVTLLCSRMDSSTVGEWYLQYKKKDLPTYTVVEEFLVNRITAYEAGDINSNVHDMKKATTKVTATRSQEKKVFFTSSSERNKCPVCPEQHRLFMCDKFKQMSITDRRNVVMKARLCLNCLNYGHQVATCRFPSCPMCGQRHNSKLHDGSSGVSESSPLKGKVNEPSTSSSAAVMYTEVVNCEADSLNVMLATAVVHISDDLGKMQPCRAVLDSGSQLNFITQSCSKRLNLSTASRSLNIVGVSSMSSSAKQLKLTTMSSRFGDYRVNVQFHSLPVIVDTLPSQTVRRSELKIPEEMKDLLADPLFHRPGPIDVLLGAEVFFEIFSGEKYTLSDIAALNSTKLGWIVTGKLPTVSATAYCTAVTINTDSALSFFISKANQRSLEEIEAERHFQSTFLRNHEGRFVVKLPLSQGPEVLGDSRNMAQKRFLNLEKRFAKDPLLAEQYNNFILDYLSLGHMELTHPVFNKPSYYLPHHAVIKADSATTKLRVVFDGSAVTNSGVSLNDIMIKGPKIQPDIFNILLRFRLHRVALTADVEKMYRQVLVDSQDCNLQRIVYRANPTEPLLDYRLKTITYGTKSASFLATRCLSELGHQNQQSAIGRVICQDFYVDDLMSGGGTDEECYSTFQQLQTVLGNAGFPLRKWCSSSVQLMNRLPRTQDDPNFMVKLNNHDDVISALGLSWQPSTDCFRFLMKEWTPPHNMSKRSLLSDVNSVYDPIGLITPVLIRGKIFIQQLWSQKLGWDDVLPIALQTRWTNFYSSLSYLHELFVPRYVASSSNEHWALHGFCDASQHAFGACIYISSSKPNGHAEIQLYTSRSRVAPLKAITIPRLELSGALLLAELISEVREELKILNIIIPSCRTYLWTDSTIVLAWINSLSLFQVYVSNRIARINDLTVIEQWRYVPSSDNPADLISRGVEAHSILSCKLWWNGPEWLSQAIQKWPISPTLPSDIPEMRKEKLVLTLTKGCMLGLVEKYTSWAMLLRVTALVYRFLYNCKAKKSNCNCRTGFISLEESNQAKRFWITNSQRESFASEISSLRSGQLVPRSSCLKSLAPFLDEHGLIRVGGRLNNASINYNAKHPIVLSAKSVITKLIFNYEHRRLMHIGPQGLLSHIGASYWIVRGRIIARKTVNDCLQCFRANPKFMSPFMAPLPRERVTIERAFARTGIDFCGPIMVRSGLRKVSPIKTYICVFVCMVTRAIHLELVSSLSTEDFLATLSRFMARRGQCSNLYSDNGTNFIGAHRIIKTQFDKLVREKACNDFLTSQEIKWKFIPPSAPHFGGLWESAVQSAKKLMIRVTQGVLLTYDETTTLLCQVEAALNSRPLFPMSSDPAEFDVLTPGHFLVGGRLMMPPEPDVSCVPKNRLRRFKLMQAQMQIFWKRWTREYLPQMQRRGKWTKVWRNAVVGDLAILRDQSLPPIQWPLVRVTQIHPGTDNVVRVVTVRNSAGTELKRPIVKIALLPTEEDEVEVPIPK